ncbi:protein RETICULATA-RELATED 3, chloroplastic-like [Solanum dulcamara]|uniref:protein RETICULATA-RELATED 3, chloroplastic-like n=1 Tax=Solanum dulcamara TaxID=45834 RepID=UPI0024869F1E|nr:protein RETICULATA-RELATED 3, chloroplastic-like [Solanum dulcamara]
MVAMSQLRYSPLTGYYQHHNQNRVSPRFSDNRFSFNPLKTGCIASKQLDHLKYQVPCAGGGDGGSIGIGRGNGGGGGGGDWSKGGDSDDSKSSWDGIGPIGAFVNGWRSRVAADPQFPFKVLMEELVGVSANVLGDMASRPNFGLNELDFVFSTLVVGSIMNFVLMYLLAPTASASIQTLPSIFANCPPSHMFQSGSYGLLSRVGTFVYKGTQFAAVGFAAGLVGTALSNSLIKLRKKMDPNFETPNNPPPTLLNAATWAIHMGISSNLRYQTLNGVEFVLAKGLPPLVFKTSVVALRCANNILGGMTFVMLAKLTGSQKADKADEGKVVRVEDALVGEKERLLDQNDSMHTADAASK